MMATDSAPTTSASSSLARRARSHKSIRLRYVGSDSNTSLVLGGDSSSSEEDAHGTSLSFTRELRFPRASGNESLELGADSLVIGNDAAEIDFEEQGSDWESPTEGDTIVMYIRGHTLPRSRDTHHSPLSVDDSHDPDLSQNAIINESYDPDIAVLPTDNDDQPSNSTFDASDIQIQLDPQMEDSNMISSEYDDLNWIPTNELSATDVSKDLRRRAVGALKSAVLQVARSENGEDSDSEQSCLGKACMCFFTACSCEINLPGPLKVEETSIDLRKAEIMGFKLGKQLFFPSLPKMLRDLWVLFELVATIVQFIVACIYISFNTNIAYNISFIALSAIGVILASLDAFVYFYTLGACRQCVDAYKNRSRETESTDIRSGFAEEGSKNQLSLSIGEIDTYKANPDPKLKWEKVKKWLNDSFELFRSLLSELLIYPLLMFDLFEIAGSRELQLQATETRLNLTLFVISSFFLIFTVYIVRFVILMTTMFQLNKLPVTCLQQQDHILVITRFMIHIVLQICTQVVCIVAVGVKIRQENVNNTTDFYVASPFLWYVVVAGWLIPSMGVVMYFLVKYYWFKDFSVGLFLDMMSLLQTQGFAEAVFHGKAKQTAEESSKKFLEKIDFISTKAKFDDRQKQVSVIYKFLYPLKIPIFFVFGTLYALVVTAFCLCLLLSSDEMGRYRVSAFDGGGISVALFVAVLFLLLANLHLYLVVMLWILFAVVLLCLLLVGAVLFLLFLPFLPCLGPVFYKHRSKLRSLKTFVHFSVN